MGSHISKTLKDHDVRVILDSFRIVVRALRESSHAPSRGSVLTAAKLFVLETMAASPGISVNDVAARVHVHQSSVSVVVSQLVEAGFLLRGRAENDKRRVVLHATSAGRAALRKAPRPPQQALIAAIGKLTASRRRALASGLEEVARAVANDRPTRGGPPLFFEDTSSTKAGKKPSRG